MSDLRELLAVYRPGLDDNDPQFAGALRQLRTRADLQRWYEPHRQFDAAIRARLATVTPPPGLRERLLAREDTIRRWATIHPVAMAAAVMALAAAAYFWLQATRQDTWGALRRDMVRLVSREYALDIASDREESLRAAFAAGGWPATFAVPVGLTRLRLEGGCRQHWRGRPVAMLCYETPETGDVWLFVVARTAVPGAPSPELPPQRQRVGSMATVAWSDTGFAYLLVAERDAPDGHRDWVPTP